MAVTGGYTPISDKPTSSGDLETWNDSSELSPHLLREARLWMDVQYISIPCAIHVVLVSLSNGLMVDLQINLTFMYIYICIYYIVQTPRIKNN